METRTDVFLQHVFWKSSRLAGSVSIIALVTYVGLWILGYCWVETGSPLLGAAFCMAMFLSICAALTAFLAQSTRQAAQHIALKRIKSGRLQSFDFNEEQSALAKLVTRSCNRRICAIRTESGACASMGSTRNNVRSHRSVSHRSSRNTSVRGTNDSDSGSGSGGDPPLVLHQKSHSTLPCTKKHNVNPHRIKLLLNRHVPNRTQFFRGCSR